MLSISFSGSSTSVMRSLHNSRSISMRILGNGGVIRTGVFFLFGKLLTAYKLKSSISRLLIWCSAWWQSLSFENYAQASLSKSWLRIGSLMDRCTKPFIFFCRQFVRSIRLMCFGMYFRYRVKKSVSKEKYGAFCKFRSLPSSSCIKL